MSIISNVLTANHTDWRKVVKSWWIKRGLFYKGLTTDPFLDIFMVILVVTKSRSVIEDKYSICSPPLLHHQEKWEKSAVLPKSSFALPWKANVRLENFVYQLNHWAHWLNRFHRLTKICAPTRIIRDHPVPLKSKCHDDKTFTAMIGEPHIMGASLFQFVIIF